MKLVLRLDMEDCDCSQYQGNINQVQTYVFVRRQTIICGPFY